MKIKKCEEIGIKSVVHILDTNCTQSKVEEIIHTLNKDDSVTGILVQLPLPEHLDEEKILNSVSYHKDIDGFNIINSGKLTSYNNPKFIPCTPEGFLKIIKYYNIDYVGKHIVMIGSSKVVGLPMGLQMLHQESTVTMCHKKTENIREITKVADILISCVWYPC